MANVNFIKTTSAYLDSLPIVEGRFTFTTDTKLLFLDMNSVRVPVSNPPSLSLALAIVDGIFSVNGSAVHASPDDTALVISWQTGYVSIVVSEEKLIFTV